MNYWTFWFNDWLLKKKLRSFKFTRLIQFFEIKFHDLNISQLNANANSNIILYKIIRISRNNITRRCNLTKNKKNNFKKITIFETQIYNIKNISFTYCVYNVKIFINITFNEINILKFIFKNSTSILIINSFLIAFVDIKNIIFCVVTKIWKILKNFNFVETIIVKTYEDENDKKIVVMILTCQKQKRYKFKINNENDFDKKNFNDNLNCWKKIQIRDFKTIVDLLIYNFENFV